MREQLQTENIKDILEETPFRDCEIQKVEDGVITDVYKLKNSETYYLKIFSDNHSLAAMLLANKLLLQEGIHIPEIVYSKEKDTIQNKRAFYIEKELKGKSIKKDPSLSEDEKEKIIIEAGKDLAKLNSIPVQGVGSIKDFKDAKLKAPWKNYEEFILNNVNNMLNELLHSNVLSKEQIDKIEKYIIKNQSLLDTQNNSFLAHGDFCLEHIYHLDGKYSGIIDFGDMRGTSKFHDLAHFYTYNRKYFEPLIKGYNSIYELPHDYLEKIIVEAVVFGVGKLWWISKEMPERLNNHLALKLFDEIVF
jgi:fructosamine-3-kinase